MGPQPQVWQRNRQSRSPREGSPGSLPPSPSWLSLVFGKREYPGLGFVPPGRHADHGNPSPQGSLKRQRGFCRSCTKSPGGLSCVPEGRLFCSGTSMPEWSQRWLFLLMDIQEGLTPLLHAQGATVFCHQDGFSVPISMQSSF